MGGCWTDEWVFMRAPIIIIILASTLAPRTWVSVSQHIKYQVLLPLHNTKKDNFIIIVFLSSVSSFFWTCLVSIYLRELWSCHPPTYSSYARISFRSTFLPVCVSFVELLRIVREGVFYGSNLITSGVHYQEVVGRNFLQIGKSESQHSASTKVK